MEAFKYKYQGIKLFIICFFILIGFNYSQQLETNQLYSLAEKYTTYIGCGLTVGNVTGNYFSFFNFSLLVVNCTDSYYLFNSQTLMTQDQSTINQTVQLALFQATAVQQSRESQYQGSITYIVNATQFLRAYPQQDGSINEQLVAQINTADLKGKYIIDSVIADKFIFLKLSNDQFKLFLRPDQQGGIAIQTFSGYKDNFFTELPEQLFHYVFPFESIEKQVLHLLVTPNWSKKSNVLQQYELKYNYNEEGVLQDMEFLFLTEYDIGTTRVSSMDIGEQFLVIGCSSCNSYNGLIEVYTRPNIIKIASYIGTSDNKFYGLDVKIQENQNFTFVYFSSKNKNQYTLSNNFINVLKIAKNYQTGNYGIKLQKQAVDFSSFLQQGSKVLFGIYNEQLLFKFDSDTWLQRFMACDNQNYYNSGQCYSCDNDKFTLQLQDQTCMQCSDLYTMNKTEFEQAIYSQKCLQYIPPKNNTQNETNNNQTNNSNNSNTNQTIIMINQAKNKGWKIAVGIVVPLAVVGLGVLIYFLAKKKNFSLKCNFNLNLSKFFKRKEKPQNDAQQEKKQTYFRKKKNPASSQFETTSQNQINLEIQEEDLEQPKAQEVYKEIRATDRESVVTELNSARNQKTETKIKKEKKDSARKKEKRNQNKQQDLLEQMKNAELMATKQLKKSKKDKESKKDKKKKKEQFEMYNTAASQNMFQSRNNQQQSESEDCEVKEDENNTHSQNVVRYSISPNIGPDDLTVQNQKDVTFEKNKDNENIEE